MQPITTPEALQSLRQQLDRCRSVGKRAVFPKELKQQAVSLSEDYSPGTIVNALAISPTSLSRWKQQINGNAVSHGAGEGADNAAAFVALPTADPCLAERYTLSIVLNCADNDHNIALNGEVTLDQWRDIVGQISQALMS